MQVTNLNQLKIKQSEVVELPAFSDGTPLIAEIKKPNLMKLMTSGKIPNTLLDVSMDMFNNKAGQVMTKASHDIKTLKDLVGMMEVLAEASLVNPTYKEFKDKNIELNENQLMGILMYTQGGLNSLEGFRKQQANNEDNKTEQ